MVLDDLASFQNQRTSSDTYAVGSIIMLVTVVVELEYYVRSYTSI